MITSQVSTGEENGLSLRVYGTEGGLRWRQEEPNHLVHTPIGEPERVLRRGNDYLCEEAQRATRLPAGHPEAFIEAFANVYLGFAAAVRSRLDGRTPDNLPTDFPTVHDGTRGVRFIEKTVESARSDRKWLDAGSPAPETQSPAI
jgi:predicted dehydrogenase